MSNLYYVNRFPTLSMAQCEHIHDEGERKGQQCRTQGGKHKYCHHHRHLYKELSLENAAKMKVVVGGALVAKVEQPESRIPKPLSRSQVIVPTRQTSNIPYPEPETQATAQNSLHNSETQFVPLSLEALREILNLQGTKQLSKNTTDQVMRLSVQGSTINRMMRERDVALEKAEAKIQDMEERIDQTIINGKALVKEWQMKEYEKWETAECRRAVQQSSFWILAYKMQNEWLEKGQVQLDGRLSQEAESEGGDVDPSGQRAWLLCEQAAALRGDFKLLSHISQTMKRGRDRRKSLP